MRFGVFVMPLISGIHEIVLTLLFALVLVVLVIYFFLQDIRATLVPVIAIPVSLVGAFMLFPLLGFSVNVFSLLALVLAIGLVVDDAIVVVEAVQVNIEKGLSPRIATQEAMKVVASPIIATTTVLMAVFLPVGLMPGAAGKLYQQFAITIALSVALSGINALSLSPALCAILLKPRNEEHKKDNALNRFFGRFNGWFNRSVDSYLKTSRVIMRHASRTLVFIALVTGVALFFIKVVPTGFLPNEDQGYLMTNIQLPSAASLERTEHVVNEIIGLLRHNDNIESVSAAAGFSLFSGTESPNAGILFIKLKDYKQRKQTADQITDALNGELYVMINEAEVYTFGPPSIPGLGPGSGFTMMLQDKGSNTPQYLAEQADKFIAAAQKRPEIATISTVYDAYVPQRAISVNNEMALKAGVPLEELHGVLTTFLGGAYVNNFNRFGKLYQTYIQAEADYRQNEQQLDLYFVTNQKGESLPLSAFIAVRDTTGPAFTNRFNLYRSAQLTGSPAKGYSSGETLKALEEVAAEVLPEDMGYAWANMSYQQTHSSGEGTVFVFAVIFVFLILAALYESWSLPVTILLGIPFAVFGAMLFIWIGHMINPNYANDIFLQVSLILLIGLAAKNAILIIEYAKDKFDAGMDLGEAAIESARLRVRPIIMTAFAFILGILPLVFATGANAVARNVMGIALCGGMLIATFIALFAYPALFVLIGKWGHYEQKRDAKVALEAREQEDMRKVEAENAAEIAAYRAAAGTEASGADDNTNKPS
ncbi:MAG: efflux RND transporter permease subunit [Rikenellaceae bacterium]|nr:efflux RND transporter permease subunit [Rikenellaceae bacterium]